MKNQIVILIGLLFYVAQTSPAQGKTPELTGALQYMVEISSGTTQSSGVGEVQKLISEKLHELHFQTEIRAGNLLVGTLVGEKAGEVTFLVHADTVFEESSGFKGFKLSADEQTATGPGVIDDKGGITVALAALKLYLRDHPKPKYSLRVISSPNEEIGSNEFLEDFKKWSAQSILVLGFEPALEDGSIIESRRGNRWYKISIEGRESHSGRAHKEGINACLELSNLLVKLSALTDYSKNITVSVGRIEGGKDKFNIVCGNASAKVDTRFSDFKSRDELHHKIEKILSKSSVHAQSDGTPAKTTYTLANDCPPFSVSKSSKKYIQKYLKIAEKEEGAHLKSLRSDGAADSNYFSRPGLATIDGLGPVGGKMHTKEEFISLKTLETRSSALAKFLGDL